MDGAIHGSHGGRPQLVERSSGLARLDAGDLRARAEALECDPLLVRLLLARGVDDEERQRRFLRPRLAELRVPAGMAGFTGSIELLVHAIQRGWRIGIFGDYDVDGVTTTAILTTFLEAVGATVVARVACRDRGYGFRVADARVLCESGVQLVLTGDCGTSDHEALAWLRERGVKTAVIDHHQVPEVAPPTDAFLNPHQQGCEFPFKGLCSAGVAFYLCAALRTALARAGGGSLPDPRAWLDLVALGTVCDMVPLIDENRILVHHGLSVVGQRRRPGLRALLDSSGVGRDERIDEAHLGFRLGPRLNAPGRLGPAEPSLLLLRARTSAEARAMADRVESCNVRRRAFQERIVAEAHALLAADPKVSRRHGIVVAHDTWLHGIVGIAASGLVEHYRRPALVLAVDNDAGEARGSARTHGDIDVRAALHACRALLRRYGGHKAAAGVSLDAARVPELVEAFDAAVGEQVAGREVMTGEAHDGELPLADVDEALIERLDQLAPFGVGFTAPRFVCEEAQVVRERLLKGKHLSMVVRQGGVEREAIAFSHAGPPIQRGDKIGLLYVPTRNHFRGRVRVQLQVESVWRTP
ncbi:MAG: single-stranded-DNA-specific exonuclease RecJ [Nannocystaceae bacterium]